MKKGATPLYIAVENGYEQIVQILLEKGANVNSQREVLYFSKIFENQKRVFFFCYQINGIFWMSCVFLKKEFFYLFFYSFLCCVIVFFPFLIFWFFLSPGWSNSSLYCCWKRTWTNCSNIIRKRSKCWSCRSGFFFFHVKLV